MDHSRDDTAAAPASGGSPAPGWEEVERGPLTVRVQSMERPAPPELAADDEPEPEPNLKITTALMERPAPREAAGEAAKAGLRPRIDKRLTLMERRGGGASGPPPGIGSMSPSRRA